MFGFAREFIARWRSDHASELAALLAYYAFVSLFPLLLFSVTLLGIVLRGNHALQDSLLSSALAQFPIIGDEIRRNVSAIADSGLALFVGLVGALWGGLAGVKGLENAMDRVWSVPQRRMPTMLARIGRSLVLLAVVGCIGLVTTLLGAVGAIAVIGSLVLNVVLFLFVYRVLTVAEVSWNDVAAGAAFAGGAWTLVQSAGGYVLADRLARAGDLYGMFGMVLGLLAWLYLGALVTLAGAEINVMRKGRPRDREEGSSGRALQ